MATKYRTQGLEVKKTYRKVIDGTDTKLIVTAKLADDCGNGHEDFSVTGDGYEKGARGSYREAFGGCCHDAIKKCTRLFDTLIDLHLCDFNGAPVYPHGNGYYYLCNLRKFGGPHDPHCDERTLAAYADGLRTEYQLTDEEVAFASENCHDSQYFKYMLEEWGVPARWKARAAEGIKQMEELTGEKFVSKATKQHRTPMTDEERAAVKERIDSGYYTPEAIKARLQKDIDDKKDKLLKEIAEEHDALVLCARIERVVDTYMAENYGLTTGTESNIIYYKHNKTLGFNWCGYGSITWGREAAEKVLADLIEIEPALEGTKIKLDK